MFCFKYRMLQCKQWVSLGENYFKFFFIASKSGADELRYQSLEMHFSTNLPLSSATGLLSCWSVTFAVPQLLSLFCNVLFCRVLTRAFLNVDVIFKMSLPMLFATIFIELYIFCLE